EELMELLHVALQCHRDDHAAYIVQCICRFVERKSCRLPKLVVESIQSVIKDLCESKVRGHLREHLVYDLVDLGKAGSLELFYNFCQYLSLPLRTLEIIAGRVTDTGIGCCKNTVQSLKPRLVYTAGTLSGNFNYLCRIPIYIIHF